MNINLGSLGLGCIGTFLVIMGSNPLENIRNSKTIIHMMKNGRIYDGNSLDEIYPTPRKLDITLWTKVAPVPNASLK